jgi:hypothetical protein
MVQAEFQGIRKRRSMTDMDATVAQLQQVLEREYPQREWRVLVGLAPTAGEADESWVFVHGRTRDFRYRCRVGRPSSVVRRARSLDALVAELAAEAEQHLADQAGASQ